MRQLPLFILSLCMLVMPGCQKTSMTLEEVQAKVDSYVADPGHGPSKRTRTMAAVDNMSSDILGLYDPERRALHQVDAKLIIDEKERSTKFLFWRKVIRAKDGTLSHLKLTFVSTYGAPDDLQYQITLEAVDSIPDTTSHAER